jgi:ribonuclease P protein component
MSPSFSRNERLREEKDIKRVFSSGKKASAKGARLLYARNGKPYNRVLFTVVRGYGTAVARNRAKRLGKEIYRPIKTAIMPGYDFVVIFYPGDDTYRSRFSQILGVFSMTGLLDMNRETNN